MGVSITKLHKSNLNSLSKTRDQWIVRRDKLKKELDAIDKKINSYDKAISTLNFKYQKALKKEEMAQEEADKYRKYADSLKNPTKKKNEEPSETDDSGGITATEGET